MPDGSYNKLVEDINARIAKDGLNSISEMEMSVLMAAKLEKIAENIEDVSQRTVSLIDSAKALAKHQEEIYQTIKRPFWYSWQGRDLGLTAAIVAGILGILKWETVAALISLVLKGHS